MPSAKGKAKTAAKKKAPLKGVKKTTKTKAKKPIVAELIYILGLEGKQEPDDGPAELKKAESDLSIYGFGHTEDQKWTFAGRKPAAAGPPTRRETETSEVVSPEDKQAAEAKK